VLIVDDEPANRDLLCRYLGKENLLLVTAANGAQAIAAYCRTPPTVVLLDLRMPGVDGFEFLRWAQEEPEERRVPILVLTAESDRNTVQQAAALGAAGYIVKPFDGENVRQRVRKLLGLEPAGA
jgi:CheY-like chemotaxis protein